MVADLGVAPPHLEGRTAMLPGSELPQLPASELHTTLVGGEMAMAADDGRSSTLLMSPHMGPKTKGWAWLRPTIRQLAKKGTLWDAAMGGTTSADFENSEEQDAVAVAAAGKWDPPDMVWVGGLTKALTTAHDRGEAPVHQLFSQFGTVLAINVRRKEEEGRSWALVTFSTVRAAAAAAAEGTLSARNGTVQLQVKRAQVSQHLNKEQPGALKNVFRMQQKDHRAAVGFFMAKLANRRVPAVAGSHEAARHWHWLKVRVKSIAAFGGFHKAISKVRYQILVSATRRLDAYVKRAGLTLEQLFDTLDEDRSGTIDAQEFRNSIYEVLGITFDNQTIQVMMQYMDADGDGHLNTREFCSKMKELEQQQASTGSVIVARLCHQLSHSGSTSDSFLGGGDTTVDAEGLRVALDEVGIEVSLAGAKEAMKALDHNSDGTLDAAELTECLREFQRKRRVFTARVLGHVVDFVARTNTSLTRLFAQVDSDGSGALDVLELQEALRKLHQDLSEMEVQDLMQELGLRHADDTAAVDDGGGVQQSKEEEAMSCSQLLDALKLYQSERVADTARCRELFAQLDQDGSGFLDRGEISKLAEHMGYGGVMESAGRSFLDTILSDIVGARFDENGRDDELRPDEVSFDELLRWFLETGRSYLPHREYPPQADLSDPSPQQLKQLFATMDADNSGEISLEEARAAIPTLWPLLDATQAHVAFEVALARSKEAAAGSPRPDGTIGVDGVLVLLRCLIWLNRKRHSVEEVMQGFRGADGVGEDEFRVVRAANAAAIYATPGCRTLGLLRDHEPHKQDRALTQHFKEECARLARRGVLADSGRMTAQQFVAWAVEHESVLPAAQMRRSAFVAEEVEARTGKYGDVFFEDLAALMHCSISRTQSSGAGLLRTRTISKVKRVSEFELERQQLLSEGIRDALTRINSFPKLSQDALRALTSATMTDGFFAGQHMMTQGELGDYFVVVRRGRVEVLVDGVVVDTVGKGAGMGEMSLLFGTRRSATVRCVTPCEVILLDRAAYQTEISKLPEEERIGGLEKILLKFWDLVASDDGIFNHTGVKQTTVPFSTYRKLHIRTAKTLTMAEDEPDFDEDECRKMSGSDWKEDTKRYGLQADGRLTMTMFFDSLYQLVNLWADGVEVSFYQFLVDLYNNIAEWNEAYNCPKFKPLSGVGCRGAEFEQNKADAQASKDAQARAQREKEEEEERRRQEAERMRVAELERLRQEAEAERRRLEAERARLERERRIAASRLRQLQRQLAALDAEERELQRRLAAGGLSAEEEDALRQRLAMLAQEQSGIRRQILQLEQAALRARLAGGGRSLEEQLFFGRDYTIWAGIGYERDSDANMLRRLDEITRELAALSGGQSDEEAERRRRAEEELEQFHRRSRDLDQQEAALRQRLAHGNQAVRGNSKLRRQIELVQDQRRKNTVCWCNHPSCPHSMKVSMSLQLAELDAAAGGSASASDPASDASHHGQNSSDEFRTSPAFRSGGRFGGGAQSAQPAERGSRGRRHGRHRAEAAHRRHLSPRQRMRFYGSGGGVPHQGGWFLHTGELCYHRQQELGDGHHVRVDAPSSTPSPDRLNCLQKAAITSATWPAARVGGPPLTALPPQASVGAQRVFGSTRPVALSPLARVRSPPTHMDRREPNSDDWVLDTPSSSSISSSSSGGRPFKRYRRKVRKVRRSRSPSGLYAKEQSLKPLNPLYSTMGHLQQPSIGDDELAGGASFTKPLRRTSTPGSLSQRRR